VRACAAKGIRTVLELGPGKVLTGLNKRIDSELTTLAVHDPAGLAAGLAACGVN
jgi:[acyl-carrier-protein] S-malonyltransferase